jgi:hypothetical protein
MPFKLGKLAPKMHPKTLTFEKYAGDELPLAPEKVYWSYKVPEKKWGMLGNNVRGCCVVSMAMHMIMNWTAHTGTMRTFTEQQAIDLYDFLTGRKDTGLVMTDFMNYWQTEGIYGDKILGWMSFNSAVPNRFKQVIWLFAAVAAGVQFPRSAMTQFNARKTWDVTKRKSPIDGGHALPFFNFGSLGDKCVTWEQVQAALNAWMDKYLDESYAVISESWFDTTTGLAPNHFKRDELWADLKKL